MTPPSRGTSRRTVVLALGTAQTLAWASTYYLPAVLADPVSADLGLSRDWFFGIFSGALLFAGLLGPITGRAIDRRGGRDVLAMSNLIFAAGLLLLASATGVAGLSAAWIVLGVGMAMGLYDAAFAALAGIYRADARAAITGITLLGGFASTIGWPVTALLTDELGWRGACTIWAALHLIVGLPLNRFLVPRPLQTAVASSPVSAPTPISGRMVLVAGVFAATLFVAAALAAHLPRLLQAAGVTPTAAVAAAALIGPAQVAARLLEYGGQRHVSALTSARVATALHPLGAVALATLGAPAAIAFAVLHGAGNGMLTIAKGVLPLALFGPAGYGMRTGMLSAPGRVLQAAAPLLFGIVLERFGVRAALLVSGGLSVMALAGLLALRVNEPPHRPNRAGHRP